MSRTFHFWPLKPLVTSYSWSIQNPTSYSRPTIAGYLECGYQAIAGPPKASPAIAGVLVVDFGWYHCSRYHYSMDFYLLMHSVDEFFWLLPSGFRCRTVFSTLKRCHLSFPVFLKKPVSAYNFRRNYRYRVNSIFFGYSSISWTPLYKFCSISHPGSWDRGRNVRTYNKTCTVEVVRHLTFEGTIVIGSIVYFSDTAR